MTIDAESIDPVIESTEDKAHRLVRAGLGLLPIGSGTAVEILNSIITPPIEKRRTQWMLDVTEVLVKLEAKDRISIASLSENKEFITLLISASQIAIKNHAKEKLESLQNIVANKACGVNFDDSLQNIFLNLIDNFSLLHIKLLKTFHEGFVWSNDNRRKPSDDEVPGLLVASIGSYGDLLDVDRSLIILCLKDLINNDLIWHWVIHDITKTLQDDSFYCNVDQWGGRSTFEMLVTHGVAKKAYQEKGKYITRTSTLGTQFVNYISKPK